MNTLREVQVGETAKVVKLHGEGAMKRRIMDMGITRGTSLKVRKVAPLGDPIEIFLRSFELTIRKEDAKKITICDSLENCHNINRKEENKCHEPSL